MIRPLNVESDAAGVVDLIHEGFPASTATAEGWRRQESVIPRRAKHASWVAIVDGTVAGRAEATLKWWSASGSAFAGVSVLRTFRGRGIGTSLWEHAQHHLANLGASRVSTMFVESAEGVAFARARGFAEARAEVLACVVPATVESAPVDAACDLLPLRDVSPEEVYEVDAMTTPDVPAIDMVDQMPYDEWLDTIWRRPSVTLDGSFGAVVGGRLASFTLLAANIERRRAFTEYTATLAEFRGRALAERVKRASLRWAADNGIAAAWTTNDETNAAMLAVNERLGYSARLRRVEYLREG